MWDRIKFHCLNVICFKYTFFLPLCHTVITNVLIFLGPFLISLFHSSGLFSTPLPITIYGESKSEEKRCRTFTGAIARLIAELKGTSEGRQGEIMCPSVIFFLFFLFGNDSTSWNYSFKSFIYFGKFSAITSPNTASATLFLIKFC